MDRGQLGALSVALLGLVIAGVVGIYGSSIAAAVIAVVPIGGPTAGIFFARGNPLPALPIPRPGRSQGAPVEPHRPGSPESS